MRRKDREVTEKNELIEIMKKCDVCRLVLNNGDYPYIVPLNFGMEDTGKEIRLYFHSAMEGYKLDLIRKDGRASFEMDCGHELEYFEDQGYCTMAYESIVGRGEVRILNESEKERALTKIMEQYHPEGSAYYNPAATERTTVYCLTVREMTGKRKLKKGKKN